MPQRFPLTGFRRFVFREPTAVDDPRFNPLINTALDAEINRAITPVAQFSCLPLEETTGFVFTHFGGRYMNGSGQVVILAAGSLTLPASSTVRLELDVGAGNIVQNLTASFTAARVPLYKVITGPGKILSIEDSRTAYGPSSTGAAESASAAALAANTAALSAAAANADYVYNTEAERMAASPANGKRGYVLESYTTYQQVAGAWVFRSRVKDILNAKDAGASGDGVSNDTSAIQAYINAVLAGAGEGKIPAGTYKITAQIVLDTRGSKAGTILGAGMLDTTLDFSSLTPGTDPVLIIGDAGALIGSRLSDMTIIGPGGSSSGIVMQAACHTRAVRVRFQNLGYACTFHNKNAGEFTELSGLEKCDVQSTTLSALRFLRTAGNDSFKGSGLFEGNMINIPANSPGCVVIEANCLVYQAPLEAQVWNYGIAPFILNRSIRPHLTVGNLHFERFGPYVLIADGGQIFHAGNVTGNNELIYAGSMKIGPRWQLASDGTVSGAGLREDREHRLTGGAGGTIIGNIKGMSQVAVICSTSNYDQRTYFNATHNGYGVNPGFVGGVVPVDVSNSVAWGQPTFTVDKDGNLIATNPNFTHANNVYAQVFITTLSTPLGPIPLKERLTVSSRGCPYTVSSPANAGYPDTGGVKMTNGLFGGESFNDPQYVCWNDLASLTVTLDLGSSQSFLRARASGIQDLPSNISFPSKVRVETSPDNTVWTLLGETTVPRTYGGKRGVFEVPGPSTARYVRFICTLTPIGGFNYSFFDDFEVAR